MTAWSWAEISGNKGSSTYDRQYADHRSRALAPSSSVDTRALHYQEKAEAREAEQREAEEYQRDTETRRKGSEIREAEQRFEDDDPRPRCPDVDDADYSERMGEWVAWESRKSKYLRRAEGEELAARIGRRW
ncbi:hypothetical protein AB0E04_12945 [Streptomyces sp. NPDC048251]|uniref:hypothetical protein n=1 Tax=Streptomyces sp. NPDC048251 TaxID=3154501 RepID=UPI0034378893